MYIAVFASRMYIISYTVLVFSGTPWGFNSEHTSEYVSDRSAKSLQFYNSRFSVKYSKENNRF